MSDLEDAVQKHLTEDAAKDAATAAELEATKTELATKSSALVTALADDALDEATIADLHAEVTAIQKQYNDYVAAHQPPRIPGRKVFAHDMSSLAREVNPAGDYDSKQFENPAGENNKNRIHGGLTRDEAIGREALPSVNPVTGESYMLVDARSEVVWAKAAGIDGFTSNILGLTGDNWKRMLEMAKACKEDGTFTQVPNIDATAGFATSPTPKQIAAAIADLWKIGAGEIVEGEYLLSSFYSNAKPPEWWASIKSELLALGYPTKLISVLLSSDKKVFDAYAPVSWAMSVWGPAVPKNVASWLVIAKYVKETLKKKWMGPVRWWDIRPRSDMWAESNNTELGRFLWAQANDIADLVQIITWDDFFEHTHNLPSVAHGFVLCKLDNYFGTWFKTGVRPIISEDALFITHRIQSVNVKVGSLPGVNLMACTLDGGGTPRDGVEGLLFASKAGTLKVNDKTLEIPGEGVYVLVANLRMTGDNVASFGDLSIVSPIVVQALPSVTDLAYHAAEAAEAA